MNGDAKQAEDDRKARWLELLDDLQWEADGTEDPTAEDRLSNTQRFWHPAAFDYLAAWLDDERNAARLRILADALMPNRVHRLRCCQAVEQRTRQWADPLNWSAWNGDTDTWLPEFEERRNDLLAIVGVLRKMIEEGRALPPFDRVLDQQSPAAGIEQPSTVPPQVIALSRILEGCAMPAFYAPAFPEALPATDAPACEGDLAAAQAATAAGNDEEGRTVPAFDELLDQQPAATDGEKPTTAQPQVLASDLQGKIDRVVALLMRDVRNGLAVRSARAYCREVGIKHPASLTRNRTWKAARFGAEQATARASGIEGSKNADGTVEAWRPADPCLNCGIADVPLVQRMHQGEALRVCEACAEKLKT